MGGLQALKGIPRPLATHTWGLHDSGAGVGGVRHSQMSSGSLEKEKTVNL